MTSSRTSAMTLEFHLLDTGHFALEEDSDIIASHIRRFLNTHLSATTVLRKQ